MKIDEIYAELVKDDQSKKVIESLYSNKSEKFTLAALGLSISLGVIFSFHSTTKEFVPIMLVLAFLFVIIHFILSAIGTFRSMIRPTFFYVSDLSKKVANETILISRLTAYDHWSLQKAKERIQLEAQRLEKRVSSIVGSLEKLGILPAVFGIYVAISKLSEGKTFINVPDYVLGVLAGAYLGAFASIQIIGRLNTMAYILGVAEEMQNQAQEIKDTHRQTTSLAPLK